MIGRSILLGCLLAAVLTACGYVPKKEPVYSTQTTNALPNSEAGRLCIAQCQQTLQLCENNSDMAYQSCKAERLIRAESEYRDYLRSLRPGEKKRRDLSSFEISSCYRGDPACSTNYTQCYLNCGGVITEQTFCTSNCDRMTPPQPNGSKVGPPRVFRRQ